jgi:hypothetical protein
MKVCFEPLRGLPLTMEFHDIDGFYRYLDALTKTNKKDPYRRRQFWRAREPDTRTVIAQWEPGNRQWKVERILGTEAPLF